MLSTIKLVFIVVVNEFFFAFSVGSSFIQLTTFEKCSWTTNWEWIKWKHFSIMNIKTYYFLRLESNKNKYRYIRWNEMRSLKSCALCVFILFSFIFFELKCWFIWNFILFLRFKSSAGILQIFLLDILSWGVFCTEKHIFLVFFFSFLFH